MPKYSFTCKECKEIWEEWLAMKDCEKPEKKPCPKCSAKKSVHRHYGKPPAMKMDSNFRIDSPHRQGGWQDAVQRMVNSPEVKYGAPDAAKRMKDKYLN